MVEEWIICFFLVSWDIPLFLPWPPALLAARLSGLPSVSPFLGLRLNCIIAFPGPPACRDCGGTSQCETIPIIKLFLYMFLPKYILLVLFLWRTLSNIATNRYEETFDVMIVLKLDWVMVPQQY